MIHRVLISFLNRRACMPQALTFGLFSLNSGACSYPAAEFRALGIPFADRGARSEEYLAAMRAIWREPKPAYHGQFVSFANVQAHPQGNIRIVMGGRSPAAYRP